MGRTADATATQREKVPYAMGRLVKPDVLERAGPEGKTIFGVDAQPSYLERWQWDREAGAPRPEFTRLTREWVRPGQRAVRRKPTSVQRIVGLPLSYSVNPVFT